MAVAGFFVKSFGWSQVVGEVVCILCMANIVDVYVYIVGAEKARSIQCSPGKRKTVPAFMLGYDMIYTQHVYYHICVVTF